MPFTKSVKYVEVINVDSKKITAKPEHVEQGKLYVGSTKKLEVGTMPVYDEHGDVTLLAGETQSFPVGKVTKSFNVIATPLVQQTVGNAEASDIISDKTAWVNGQKITGNIPTHVEETINLNAGDQQSLTTGYYKDCKVVGAALAGQTDGTAIDSDILAGKTAWVNGQKVTGSMKKNIPINVKIGAGETYNLEPAYYQGGKITSESIVESTAADATPNDILLNKTAWVNGQKVTGNIGNVVPTQYTLPINGEYTIPRGYHTGLGSVIQNVETMAGLTITPTNNTQRISTSGKYMIGDVVVSPVSSAVSFEIPDEQYIIDKKIESAASLFTIPVDNWHDNNTINVYQVIIDTYLQESEFLSSFRGNIIINGIDKKYNKLSEMVFTRFLLTEEYETMDHVPYFKCIGYIDKDTMQHTFDVKIMTYYYKINRGERARFKVKELFRARNFGQS